MSHFTVSLANFRANILLVWNRFAKGKRSSFTYPRRWRRRKKTLLNLLQDRKSSNNYSNNCDNKSNNNYYIYSRECFVIWITVSVCNLAIRWNASICKWLNRCGELNFKFQQIDVNNWDSWSLDKNRVLSLHKTSKTVAICCRVCKFRKLDFKKFKSWQKQFPNLRIAKMLNWFHFNFETLKSSVFWRLIICFHFKTIMLNRNKSPFSDN